MRLGDYIEELCEKTNINNQYEVLTSSQNGIVSQKDYFNKQVASENNIGYKIIKKGEFTYRSMSDTGLFYINQLINYEIGIVSPAYPVFRISNNNLDPEFLQFYFQSSKFQHQICNQSTGSTRLALKFRKLASLDISIPSLIKQKKIICNLKTFKNAIKIEEKQLFLLDELIKSRFIELFGDIVCNDKSWTTEAITKVCPIKQYDGKITECDGKVWLLNLDLVESNTGTVLDKYYVAKNEIGNSTITFSENNVLYSKLRPYLNKVIIPDGNGYATSELVPFYPLSQVNKYYLAYALRSDSFVTLINSKANGAKMPRAPMDFIRSFPLPLPPIELQNEFAEFVKQVDKLKFVVQKRIELYKELLDKKMDEYFN